MRPILARHLEIDGPPRLCVRQGIPPSRPHSARSREPRHRSRHRRLCAGSIRARRQPFRASPSAGGVACGHTNGSRHWVSASRPPAAVTAGGHPVSRGRRSLSGQRQRAAQAGLASMLGRGEDRVRGDLRAGAGRRGDRDERRLRFGDRQPSAADARALDLALIDRGLPDTDDLDVTGHRHHPKSLWPTRRPEGDVKMELLIVLLRRCRGRDAAAPAEPAGDPETLARRGGRASVLRQRPQTRHPAVADPGDPAYLRPDPGPAGLS